MKQLSIYEKNEKPNFENSVKISDISENRIFFRNNFLGAGFGVPWFQRFIFIIFIAKGGGKINLWLKAAIDSSSRANQFELGSDPDSVS